MTTPPTAPSRRPASVVVVAALVVLEGLLVVAAGIALVVYRDNELVQIPALLARVDESLPFDDGQDLGAYMAAVGGLVVALGVVLALLGWGVARGSRVAYVVALVLLVGLAVADLVVAGRVTDDLGALGLRSAATVLGVTAVVLLALLLGRRSRAWVLGHRG